MLCDFFSALDFWSWCCLAVRFEHCLQQSTCCTYRISIQTNIKLIHWCLWMLVLSVFVALFDSCFTVSCFEASFLPSLGNRKVFTLFESSTSGFAGATLLQIWKILTCLIKKWSTWFNMTPSSCMCMTTFHLRSYAMTMLIVQSSICFVTWRWMIALYAQWFCLKVLVAHPALSKAMWLKFLIIWRFARLWALCDGIEVVENMQRCVCNLASALQPGLKSRTLLCEAKATTTASQASGGGGLLASLSMRN